MKNIAFILIFTLTFIFLLFAIPISFLSMFISLDSAISDGVNLSLFVIFIGIMTLIFSFEGNEYGTLLFLLF